MPAAVFLDRDGVINENRDDYVQSWEEVRFLPGVWEALGRLSLMPFLVVIVSNQSPIGRGILSQEQVEGINRQIVAEIEAHGGRIDAVYYCPHHPEAGCQCRKPRPGLLFQAAEDLDLDLASSYLVGDAVSDIEAALSAGCRPILVLTGRGQEQEPLLQQQGYNRVPVKRDLEGAVALILDGQEQDLQWNKDQGPCPVDSEG
jgi:D-glycero-D-manno-heptose 1,7-bisphosphate phosphatase